VLIQARKLDRSNKKIIILSIVMNTIILEHVGPLNPLIQLHVWLLVHTPVYAGTHIAHGPWIIRKIKKWSLSYFFFESSDCVITSSTSKKNPSWCYAIWKQLNIYFFSISFRSAISKVNYFEVIRNFPRLIFFKNWLQVSIFMLIIIRWNESKD